MPVLEYSASQVIRSVHKKKLNLTLIHWLISDEVQHLGHPNFVVLKLELSSIFGSGV